MNHPKQNAPWASIDASHKHVTVDGTRMVLVNIDGATCLVPWFGPLDPWDERQFRKQELRKQRNQKETSS
jgi:hypothetical protein